MSINSKIRSHIKRHHYIKIDDMMKEALFKNNTSYYQSIKNLGREGDFLTSPEISQLFGEMVALWAIQKWKDMGSPKKFALIELGPGLGTLMKDTLRVSRLVNNFYMASNIFLYEINPFFIHLQKSQLNLKNNKIYWINNIEDIPPIPAIWIANEFFDALPIKQYLKLYNQWFEKTIIIDPVDKKMKFNQIEIDNILQSRLLSEHTHAENGATVEESNESLHLIHKISIHVKKYKGAALIVDYGYNIANHQRKSNQYNSTLQGIKNHQYSSIMSNFGKVDLTAHVDFYALSEVVKKQNIQSIVFCSQREFLIKYGIELRLMSLQHNLSKEDFAILEKQFLRLTASHQMGELFKVLELLEI